MKVYKAANQSVVKNINMFFYEYVNMQPFYKALLLLLLLLLLSLLFCTKKLVFRSHIYNIKFLQLKPYLELFTPLKYQ